MRGTYAHELRTNGVVGRVQQMNPKSIKANCRKHDKCVCWVSLKPPEDNEDGMVLLREELLEWIAAGHDRDMSPAAHADMARELKISHGMKVKA